MRLFRIIRILRTALRAIRRNPMRTTLTMLGIIIGVAAVIAMMEIGSGSSNAIKRTIAKMGANNFIILPGAATSGGIGFGAGSILTLTPQDCDAIIRECPAVRAARPSCSGPRAGNLPGPQLGPYEHLRHNRRLPQSPGMDGFGRRRGFYR